jgi:hypothetical protein
MEIEDAQLQKSVTGRVTCFLRETPFRRVVPKVLLFHLILFLYNTAKFFKARLRIGKPSATLTGKEKSGFVYLPFPRPSGEFERMSATTYRRNVYSLLYLHKVSVMRAMFKEILTCLQLRLCLREFHFIRASPNSLKPDLHNIAIFQPKLRFPSHAHTLRSSSENHIAR